VGHEHPVPWTSVLQLRPMSIVEPANRGALRGVSKVQAERNRDCHPQRATMAHQDKVALGTCRVLVERGHHARAERRVTLVTVNRRLVTLSPTHHLVGGMTHALRVCHPFPDPV